MNKELLGQFFTPNAIVDKMVALIQNNGKVLEPSCGNGAFYNSLKHLDTVGIEIDPEVACEGSLVMDFFDWTEKVDTIIGNPPYVKYQHISNDTLNKLPQVMDKRANLYLFFMWRCIDLLKDNGELIFIVPRDFIKTTSSGELNRRLYEEGGFTYWEEFGDEKIFPDADPNVVIFRWVKNQQHTIPVTFSDGYLYFGEIHGIKLDSLFDVRVGAVSGANDIFYQEDGNIEIAVSTTKADGILQKAWYVDSPNKYLLEYKEQLLSRGIRNFNESNWWEWGRKITPLTSPAIFVNCKTRDMKPFYIGEYQWYDGSLLALIPKTKDYALEDLVELLNNTDWASQGFQVGGRLVFGQRSLSNAYLIL